jgi:predicted ATPase
MKRIVLTGGPGSGKTEVSRRLMARHPGRIVAVPEAATQLYLMMQTNLAALDPDARRTFQHGIYGLQVAQEQEFAQRYPDAILLFDRGTVDGAIYWPKGPADFWKALELDHAAELRRYDLVIWMETCAAIGVYDGAASNACRSEDAAGAIASGRKLLEVWGSHPRFVKVDAYATIDDKVAAVESIILPGCRK